MHELWSSASYEPHPLSLAFALAPATTLLVIACAAAIRGARTLRGFLLAHSLSLLPYAIVMVLSPSVASPVLARQLFATGKVDSVHVYSNIVTVDVAKGYDSAGLADIVREMYRYWKPGVEPPTFEDQPAEEASAAPAAAAGGEGGEGGDAQLSAAAQKVPAHLLERSKAALARWNAANPG